MKPEPNKNFSSSTVSGTHPTENLSASLPFQQPYVSRSYPDDLLLIFSFSRDGVRSDVGEHVMVVDRWHAKILHSGRGENEIKSEKEERL